MKKTDRLSYGFGLIILFIVTWGVILNSSHDVLAQATDFNLLLNNNNVYSEPSMSKVGYLQSYTDPDFNTRISRITDAAILGKREKHFYAKQNPWNSNSSYVLLVSGGAFWHLHDGQNYSFIRDLNIGFGGLNADPVWHPTDPNIIFYMYGNEARKIDVRTNTVTTLHKFSQYAYIWTQGEGTKVAPDGRTLLVGMSSASNAQDMFVYNYITDKVGPAYPLKQGQSNGDINWAGIALTGKYAAVAYNGVGWSEGDGLGAYSIDNNTYALTYLGNLFNKWYHEDFAIDTDGSDVIVTSDTSMAILYKLKFADLSKTMIQNFGYWGMGKHYSGSCSNKPGWILVSTYAMSSEFPDGVDEPFEDEVYALKLDGSSEVRRIAHTRSSTNDPSCGGSAGGVLCDYWATPRVTANKDCSKIMFDSNFRDVSNNGSKVDVYVVDLSGNGSPIDTVAPAPPANLQVVLN